jgi:hypothetical protein
VSVQSEVTFNTVYDITIMVYIKNIIASKTIDIIKFLTLHIYRNTLYTTRIFFPEVLSISS